MQQNREREWQDHLRGQRAALSRRDSEKWLKLKTSAKEESKPNVVVLTAEEKERREYEEGFKNRLAREWGSSGGEGFSEIDYFKFNPNYRRLGDFIGIDPNEIDKWGNELTVVMNWAREQTKSEDILDVLAHLKKVKRGLGFGEVGETALRKLYQYVRLSEDSKRVKKEQELLKEV